MSHLVFDYSKNMFKFRHPFTCVIAGPTQSGKTEFLLKVIDNAEKLIESRPTRIIWCYGEYQKRLETISHLVQLSDNLEILETLNPKERTLIILDDLMDETGKSQNISKLFTKGSHHRNLSVILVTQYLFYQSDVMRIISRNSMYMVIFKNPRDTAQISRLGQQMFPKRTKYVEDAYRQATEVAHGYLIIDFTQQAKDNRRLMTGILPGEEAVWFIPA